MITIVSSAPSARRTYDHRLRELVCSTGDRTLARRLSIPRSTITSWRRRGVRPVVTVDVGADLRHSFASQAVIGRAPLNQVQSWLGHSTITMTMRYAHLAPGSGAEFISVLESPAAVATTWQQK